jgi:hypothetical protein
MDESNYQNYNYSTCRLQKIRHYNYGVLYYAYTKRWQTRVARMINFK